ncbi:MAG: type II secretion system protein [Ilumatobacter sp.]
MNKNQDKGFTLVELLIVIVILGILATVTVFAVSGVTSEANENACGIEQKNIETAIAAYNAENSGAFPTQASDVSTYGVDAAAVAKFTITWGNSSTAPTIASGSGTGACTV